jgi:hypothetical protein
MAAPPEVPRQEASTASVAPTPPPRWKADPLLPGARHGSIGVASGVPFLALGEVAYAPTEQFAIGAIAGATPFVLGLGVRPRVGLPLNDRTRMAFVSPLLYYPTGEGLVGDGPPWFLAQPTLRVERRIGEAGYAYVGAGAIGALGTLPRSERREQVVTYNDRRVVERDTQWGVWNTVATGGAVGIFERTLVFADAMLIMRGVRLAGDEWIGGPPFTFTFGVARVL